MLTKAERLTKNTDFVKTYSIKRSVSNSLFILYIGEINKNPQFPTKAGFVVGKKIHKKATKRNKIKRHLREAFRKYKLEHPEYNNYWFSMVFLARADSLDTDFNQVYNAVENCINKALKRYSEHAKTQ